MNARLPDTSPQPPPLTGVQVAVVEDDHGLRNDLVDFFQWRGATVTAAESAEVFWAGWDQAVSLPRVVLDLGLPGVSGLALAVRLRQCHPATGS